MRRRASSTSPASTTTRFFHEAEARILDALRRFAESAAGGAGVRRRLFADDAAQGVALIDLVRTRFDVVLMNPPFGAGSLAGQEGLREELPAHEERRLCSVRRARHRACCSRAACLARSRRGPASSCRASRSGARRSCSRRRRLSSSLISGYGVLDSAMVEVAAYCLEKSVRSRHEDRLPASAGEPTTRRQRCAAAIRARSERDGRQRFEVDPQSFAAFPARPLRTG